MLDKFTKLVKLILEGKYHPLDKDKEPIKISDRFSIIAGKNVRDKKWRIPYITQSKDLDGAYIYTAYSNSGIKGDDRKEHVFDVYKQIKNNVNDDTVQELIKKAVVLIGGYLKQQDGIPDSLLVVNSSSSLNLEFAEQLSLFLGGVELIPNAISKADVENLKIVKEPKDEKMRQNLERVIQKAKEEGKFSSKMVHRSLRMYLGDFMRTADYVSEYIDGKFVIVVDDILTTRSTMAESFRLVRQYNPAKVIGITLFKT